MSYVTDKLKSIDEAKAKRRPNNGFVELDGGIRLPLPKGIDPFIKPEGIAESRWRADKTDRWYRAYTHCLYSMLSMFEFPVHSVVPSISKKMLEADNAFSISYRFLCEMKLQGYVKFIKRRQWNKKVEQERVLVPTKKFMKLSIDHEKTPDTVEVRPSIVGEDYMSQKIVIRGGIRSRENIKAANITKAMMEERFKVNDFVLEVLEKFPAITNDDPISMHYMYNRALTTARDLSGKTFRFPHFLDSRSRMYTATTCALDTQGADHEKALVISTYSEVLTDEGYLALEEAAHGYSEMNWDTSTMVNHGRDPYSFTDWQEADKPYSYLACARLIFQYHREPTIPLPAFTPLDGRCSGLQHWSAVVRSNAITKHIGMHEIEADRDIYEHVADLWKESLDTEFKVYATRKAAKIPVMTWGYNATMMTSMEHLGKIFGRTSKWCVNKEEFVTVKEGLERATTNAMGRSIYRRLNDTLGPLTAAVEYVSNAASTIAKAGNADITWPTLDGFMCKQRKIKSEPVSVAITLSNGEHTKIGIRDFTGNVPDSRKHKSAIAPNIIHSLDATHLRMVAKRLKLLGIPMIFIHDSFSTHCNYRDVLYKEIIDTFIELYSTDYLATLKEYWESTYNVQLPDSPVMGDWEPESIRKLTKFFM